MPSKKIHGDVKAHQSIGGKVTTSSAVHGEIDKDAKGRSYKDYNILINKPQIEGTELIGNKKLPDFGIPYVFFDTVEGWASKPSLIAKENAIYVYTDYQHDSEGNNVPGFKVGDGLGYLVDAPFVDAVMQEHIMNNVIHVTAEEKEFWNNKVRVYIDSENLENLVFTTH